MRSARSWAFTQPNLIVTDVSGKPVDSIFKNQAVPGEFLGYLTLENGAGRLSRNVGNKLSTLRKSQKRADFM
jgi:hypothetical protein